MNTSKPRASALLLSPVLGLLLGTSCVSSGGPVDPLPSWNDGGSKDAIVDFVARVTSEGSADFVPEAERVAVFDNDGTLWVEQPMYVQLAFAFDRVRALAQLHPEWREQQPFQAVLEGDLETLAGLGEEGLLKLVMATHTGMTTAEFEELVAWWLETARHPTYGRPYTELVYQPMLELLDYLRAHDFKTFIVSGGGIEFMRPWAEAVYGVPPEQVIGSTIAVEYHLRGGEPVLTRLPELNFVDNEGGKPVGIHYHIGRRPIAAFGNSDGDFQMLEWVTAGAGARLGVLVHHDDVAREYRYDRTSPFGRLAHGLDAAPARGWVVVSMRKDWGAIFPGDWP